MIHERLDDHSGSLAVVGDLLVRDLHAVDIPHDVGSPPKRNLEVDVVCEA